MRYYKREYTCPMGKEALWGGGGGGAWYFYMKVVYKRGDH